MRLWKSSMETRYLGDAILLKMTTTWSMFGQSSHDIWKWPYTKIERLTCKETKISGCIIPTAGIRDLWILRGCIWIVNRSVFFVGMKVCWRKLNVWMCFFRWFDCWILLDPFFPLENQDWKVPLKRGHCSYFFRHQTSKLVLYFLPAYRRIRVSQHNPYKPNSKIRRNKDLFNSWLINLHLPNVPPKKLRPYEELTNHWFP